jgi:outer membrane protein, heavy metal efflux system
VRPLVILLIVMVTASARAEAPLPAPLGVGEVVTIARARRAEPRAGEARARAAAQRPAIVSALDDPMIMGSLDHVPFSPMGADASLMIEQRFPLSRVRGHRARGAEAGARREAATAQRIRLDVELEAAEAFWMLARARDSARILDEQHALAEQLVSAALARYATNTGPQADVLRAQIEVARLDAERRAAAAEIRAAEVMLNTSLARDPDGPIPELDTSGADDAPPPAHDVSRAAERRPELRAGRAELAEAEAEVEVMRSMYAPMAMVRLGPAYTMAEGSGWMLMVGVSVPLWRGRLRAGEAEARAMVEMATAELEAMRRMMTGEARVARENVIAARVRYLALRDGVLPRAHQAIGPTIAAYAAGQVPLISALEAARELWSVRRELVAARAALGTAWARLYRASSGEDGP